MRVVLNHNVRTCSSQLVRKRRRVKFKTMNFWKFIRVFLRLIFFIINNIYGTTTYIAWYVVLLPLKLISPKTFSDVENVLYENLVGMVPLWGALCGHQLLKSGDDVSNILNDETLVIVNHQTPVDIIVMMHFAYAMKTCLQSFLWVMDWIIMFTNIGWVAKGHGDYFLLQLSDYRRFKFLFPGTTEAGNKVSEIKRIKEHITKMFSTRNRKWVLIFPEGGFLKNRRPGSHRFAKKNGLPLLNNVALPYSGAVESIVEGINKSNNCLKWIIDVTLAYENNHPMSFINYVLGLEEKGRIYVHIRKFPASAINNNGILDNSEDIQSWLINTYKEKEDLINNFKVTNQFVKNTPCKVIPYSCFRGILSHCFSVSTFYIVVKVCTALML